MKTILLTIVLLMGCSACAPKKTLHLGGASYDPPIVGAPFDTASHLWAITKCDNHNRPVIIVSFTMDESQLYYVIEHEKTHVRQVERYEKGCLDFQDRYSSDKDFRFRAEAEAYCVGFEAAVNLRGIPYREKYPYLVMFMSTLFPDRPAKEIWEEMPCHPEGMPYELPTP